MPSVELSERAYREAEEAAASSGMSVAEYIEERLTSDDAFTMTPDRLALVRESQADLRAGLGKTLEETWASLDRRKADWRQKNDL